MREFSSFHPFVILSYFGVVIFFTMFQWNPVFLGISLVASIVFGIKALGIDEFKKKILFSVFFFLIVVIANPIFVHDGVTPLFYANGNAITLEALIYGLAFAMMLISVIYWFNSFSKIMTSDKIIYIFSAIIPTIGLIISMVLRFIPQFQRQLKKIMDINKVAGDPYKSKSISHRIATIFKTFSILLTWAFENSIDTANSMKARGYGLKGRTTFHLFKFEKRDFIFIITMGCLVLLNVVLYKQAGLRFYYYPEIATVKLDALSIISYISYVIMFTLPLIIEKKEELKWKSLVSKI
ncbi:MAG: energy-coupling factor transporter transmembrane component T [Erysipelotrichales bacterium]